ncbi:hypothetical protein IFM89_033707 [Coptis chinensis]|uniref:Putative zinc-finger domain-containing protein n=1 Tax=Coptis chinensis TaxID=261450 RepID=A0A835HH35_9MAGN|nr:hypothetical protein IFM89_033707 [Coptis chinensis]
MKKLLQCNHRNQFCQIPQITGLALCTGLTYLSYLLIVILSAGKLVPVNDPASSVDIRLNTSVKQNSNMPFTRSLLPSKPVTHYSSAWYSPSASNHNLVISFSDDDSGSDSQEHRRDSTSEKVENQCGEERSSAKSEPIYAQKNVKNQVKRMPKKVSLSRTFVSSITKIHGANSRGSGPSLAGQVSRIRNSDPLSKVSASQEHELSPGMNGNDTKLEDLRQQIAKRENQIRLQAKSVQQSKNTDSDSFHGNGSINLNSIAAKKSRLVAGDTRGLVSNEPEKKRLKLEPYQRKVNLDGQQKILEPATNGESIMRKSLSGDISQDGEKLTCSQLPKDVTTGILDSVTKHSAKIGNHIPVSSRNLVPIVKDGESSKPFRESTSSKVQSHKLVDKLGAYDPSGSDISSGFLQSSNNNRSIDHSRVDNPIMQLLQITTRADVGTCQVKMSSPNKPNTDVTQLPGTSAEALSFIDKATEYNVVQSSDCDEVMPSDNLQTQLKDSTFNKYSALERELGDFNACPSNSTLRDYLGEMNLLGENRVNIQTLLQMEVSHDKELEEAQEHRHRCELEERSAFKAYREAQRALIEANARCTYHYRKRETFSAQFRAFMMEDSSWSKDPKDGIHSLNNVAEADTDSLPPLSHQAHAEIEVLNRDSRIQCTDGAIVHTSSQKVRGSSVHPEPCSEPDASVLKLLHYRDNDLVNGICTPSHRTNVSADEDEDVPRFSHNTTQSMVVGEDVENLEQKVWDINESSKRASLVDSAKDYALLEASLRSELFARLGVKNVSKNRNLFDQEKHTANDDANCLVEKMDSHTTMSRQLDVESEAAQKSELQGTDGLGRGICSSSIQLHTQVPGDKCADYQAHRIGDPEESSSSPAEACRPRDLFPLPSPVLNLSFSHVKVSSPISNKEIQNKVPVKCINSISHKEESGLTHSEFSLCVIRAPLKGNMGELGSYACDHPIDPFWPVCLFELRGKCNDRKCLWQHVKDYSGRSMKQHDCSQTAGCEDGLSSNVENIPGACSLSRCRHHCTTSAPPTYLVGLDVLKPEMHTSGTGLVRSIGPYRRKGFSTSSAIPYTIQSTLLSNVPLLRGTGGRLGWQMSRSRESVYYQSQDDSSRQIRHGLDDPEQCLDMALVLFDGDINSLEGKNKALSVLSRALEADPTSVTLWVVYLHILYRNENTTGKDDMFSAAIRYNEDSYELLLMYINSRLKLDDHLAAYDFAIAALCRHANSPNKDRVHVSACILDLFLQSMGCLCMSGGTCKAIQRISGLLLTATDGSCIGSVFLSDILACLTLSDKCIFWVCCVYIVIYQKLPDAVSYQFELEKELKSVVEWPSIQLTDSKKHRALDLMKIGVNSVTLNGGKHEKEVQFLCLSHVQCVAALEGIDCSRSLLDKYIKAYPTFLELILTSARLHRSYFGNLNYEGFEEALRKWPREIPGVQCIWNQYAHCAVVSGGLDFAKQLMLRWFESVCKGDCLQNGERDLMEDDCFYGSSESCSPKPDVCFTHFDSKDELFGLLNLSLYRLLQKDKLKAHLAIDKALKIAGPEYFEHCVREHAIFSLSHAFVPVDDACGSGILSLLNRYLVDSRVLPVSEPLSRKFCQGIRKPRIRQLISNILGPIPNNYSLINSVLESCYGPSLLPENYVCKLITVKSVSSGIASASVSFWACSLLVNSIYQAYPVAPEHTWVEVSGILSNLVEAQGMFERFHQCALSVYPFSAKLWTSYYNFLKKKTGSGTAVVQIAKERGIKVE